MGDNSDITKLRGRYTGDAYHITFYAFLEAWYISHNMKYCIEDNMIYKTYISPQWLIFLIINIILLNLVL